MVDYIRPKDLPAGVGPQPNDLAIPADNGIEVVRVTPAQIVATGRPIATEAQAIAGTDNDVAMTPLTTAQAMDSRLPSIVQPYVDRAQAWAESASPPNPSDPSSKSAKTWAQEASVSASTAIAQAAQTVTFQRRIVVTAAGVTTYSQDSDANALSLTETNHILFGGSPFGPLTYGVDYTTAAGNLVLAFSPAANELLHVFAMPVFTNSQAQALVQGYRDELMDGRFPSGTVALPGVATVADPDTGISWPVANTLVVSTGGAERARVTSAGLQVTGLVTGSAVQASVTDAAAGKLLTPGAFGLGGQNIEFSGDIDDHTLPTGFYFALAAATGAKPNINGSLQVSRRQAGSFAHQRFISRHATSGVRVYERMAQDGVWTAWTEARSTYNTTVDANGFVKAASPIARIGGGVDPAHGFMEAGDGAVNDQAAGVTITSPAVGVYEIHGSAGLAHSGWQIEVPRDHNGNPLCHVATDWQAGVPTILVSTPVWSDGRWTAGDPADVPAGRWIDVRLHEIEIEEI